MERTEPVQEEHLLVSQKTFAVLREALKGVVLEPGGTGRAARSAMTDIAGKTGTAQVVSMAQGSRGSKAPNLDDHAWFVAFAPAEAPRIAVTVLVEHGGHGGSAAAPIAKQVIETYLRAPVEPTAGGTVAAGEGGGRRAAGASG
jgi:penicillin-binding protein 2